MEFGSDTKGKYYNVDEVIAEVQKILRPLSLVTSGKDQ